jgi:hypothetical protein
LATAFQGGDVDVAGAIFEDDSITEAYAQALAEINTKIKWMVCAIKNAQRIFRPTYLRCHTFATLAEPSVMGAELDKSLR